MTRARNATTEARAAVVERLLMTGAPRSAVLAHARTEWGISTRSADRLLALARQRIREHWAQTGRDDLAALLLSQLATLQQQARQRGDLAVALGCINAAVRLAGLA